LSKVLPAPFRRRFASQEFYPAAGRRHDRRQQPCSTTSSPSGKPS